MARLGLAAALAAAAGSAAVAQAPHAIPPPVRSLHERTAEAPLIVIGRVAGAGPGRVAVQTERALRGTPPPTFEVKCSPLRPPALADGGRALLLLRGARSPYVLAGDASELMPIESEADAQALAGALPALLAAGDDLAAVARVYEDWAASGSGLLHALGADGILALRVPLTSSPEPAAKRSI